MKILANYMIATAVIASVLLAGCESSNSKNESGVPVVPSQNEQVLQNENSAETPIDNEQVSDETSLENQATTNSENIDKQSQNNTTNSEYITQDEAKNIAFSHAGVSQTEVSFVKCEFDIDKGIAEYEVDFYVGTTEYDYEINAQTGEVISYGIDLKNQTANQSATQDYITLAQAKSIALSHAGISENETSFMQCEFDYDKGLAKYEVEFNIGKTEYEYEINAQTGEIIAFEKD